jgi:hypothetical protein
MLNVAVIDLFADIFSNLATPVPVESPVQPAKVEEAAGVAETSTVLPASTVTELIEVSPLPVPSFATVTV